MTEELKKETPSQDTSPQKPKRKIRLPLIAVLGIGVIILVVGLAIFWEKEIEPLVRVDLPHEGQKTSEASSFLPYICDQDPEACGKAPLTFQGREEAGTHTGPIISYPPKDVSESKEEQTIRGVLEKLPFLQEIEERLTDLQDIGSIRKGMNTLVLLTLTESVLNGELPCEDLVEAVNQMGSEKLRSVVSQLPQTGTLIAFDNIPLAHSENEEARDDATMWGKIKAWGATLIEIKTTEVIEAEVHLSDFKRSTLTGDYNQAMKAFRRLSPKQRAQYEPWVHEIQKRQQLTSLKQHLLHGLVKRDEG